MKGEMGMEKSNDKGLHTILGEGTILEGTLTVPHSVRIDGQLKGKIETSETLTVGSTGNIEADIVAKSAIIGGTVRGNLSVEDRVELDANASLIGDLKTRDLIINEGATFHGNCSMDVGKNVKV
jgi:cytoskeletal protein CcmA (bactofilin family)